MQCRYCRAWNEEDERRCVRCGRRMHLSPRPAPDTFPLATATAPALEMLPGREPTAQLSAAAAAGAGAGAGTPGNIEAHITYQPSLFRDVSNAPKVIPIPTLTPVRPRENPEWDREERARDESALRRRALKPPSRGMPRTGTRGANSQQSLDFYANAGQPGLGVEVEAVIYCDAPVAMPLHRMIAAGFDAAMVLLAVGLFLVIFVVAGGAISLNFGNAMFFLGVAGLLALFYRFLWCIANGDSPGMRFAGLRLVDFDGRVPDRDRRGMRQVAGLLSVISAGLGLVWALVDEENLTWHDHISKTFPTAS